jgi:hypothetical protein
MRKCHRNRFCIIGFLCLAHVALLGAQPRKTTTERKSNSPPSSAATRCLEQNLKAEGDDIMLPCVEGLPTPLSDEPGILKDDNENHLVHELTSYRSGYFLHDDILKFCHDLIEDIYSISHNGKRVKLIVITGQADGQRNRGIPKGREKIPERCQNIAPSQTIDDAQLAALRGCVLWDFLSSILEDQKTVTGFGWKPDEIKDIPDGGSSGNPYRKVTVEVIWDESR